MRHIELQFFVITLQDLRDACPDEATYTQLKGLIDASGDYISLPYANFIDLSSWVVEKEDYDAQEQVFSELSITLQNIIYGLDQRKYLDNPQSTQKLVLEL